MTSVEQRLKIDTAETEDGLEIMPQGDLDVATAPHLLETLQAVFAKGPTDTVLDASRLDFVDSAGLSLLVTLHKRSEVEGKRLVIRSPGPQLSRLLELTALTGYFHLA
jgi:anti-sigma B factor antagonist